MQKMWREVGDLEGRSPLFLSHAPQLLFALVCSSVQLRDLTPVRTKHFRLLPSLILTPSHFACLTYRL